MEKMIQRDKENFVEGLVDLMVEGFKKSGYPSRAFNFYHQFDESGNEVIDLHIRIPSIRPSFVNEKYETHTERNAACPAIERILLPEGVRNQGIFSQLVIALGKLPSVDAVCVSHVTNSGFSNYLNDNDSWLRLDNNGFKDSPFYEFFKSEPPTYYKIFDDNVMDDADCR
jgi:hypothetical protein